MEARRCRIINNTKSVLGRGVSRSERLSLSVTIHHPSARGWSPQRRRGCSESHLHVQLVALGAIGLGLAMAVDANDSSVDEEDDDVELHRHGVDHVHLHTPRALTGRGD
jgi:hypothetical protein